MPSTSRLAFLQFYLPAANGRRLDRKYDGDNDVYFDCHPTTDADPSWQQAPIRVADRREVYLAFLEGLERTSTMEVLSRAETPPEAGPPELPLGPTAPPDLCRVFSFGSDAAEMKFESLFGPTSLLDLAPGPPAPESARLATEAHRVEADALLRVLLVPWQWSYASDGATPHVTNVEIFAEALGYDQRGRRFLWDLFRSAPREIQSPDDAGASGEMQDLLLQFAKMLGARVASEGFDGT
jgi:hypothetical protein